MSYDLVLFDPSRAPAERDEFLRWFGQQEHGETDPAHCSACLRGWLSAMGKEWPSMDGPIADEDEDNPKLTEYNIGDSSIYAAFAWSVAEEARTRAWGFARLHGLGFYDISDPEGFIWWPPVDRRFDVFYCFYATDEQAPSDQPVRMDLQDVIDELLPKMISDGDFIGLEDTQGTTFQFMYHTDGNRIWLDMPCPEQDGAYGCFIPRAELVDRLQSLPDTFTPEDIPELEFESWSPQPAGKKPWWRFW